VDTSYNTHHLQFDWQGRIWTDGDVLGELDTTKLDPANPKGLKLPRNTPGCASIWTRKR
jgi:hypothetical protein